MKITTKTITMGGLFIAIEVILQLIGNNVSPGGVSFNLSLIPIVIASICSGPFLGAFVGLVNGILVLFSPATMAVFMPLSVGGTILVCLSKSTISGLICGLIFKFFKKNKFLGAIIASISAPIINTGFFIGYSFIFFQEWIDAGASSSSLSGIGFLLLIAIGWNFVFEFLSTSILSPVVYKVIEANFKPRNIN